MKVTYITSGKCEKDGEEMCVCQAEKEFVKYLGKHLNNNIEYQYKIRQEKFKQEYEERNQAIQRLNQLNEEKKKKLAGLKEEKKQQLLFVAQDPNYNFSNELVVKKREEIAGEILAIQRNYDQIKEWKNAEYHPLPIILFSIGMFLARKEIECDEFEIQEDGENAWLQVGGNKFEFEELRQDFFYMTSWFVNYNAGKPQQWVKGNSKWYQAFLDFGCNSLISN